MKTWHTRNKRLFLSCFNELLIFHWKPNVFKDYIYFNKLRVLINSQVKKNENPENLRYTGIFKKYEYGKLDIKFKYINGHIIRKIKFYYYRQLTDIILFKKYINGDNEYSIFYRKDGTKCGKYYYKNGVKHGIGTQYRKNGTVSCTFTYKNGVRHGERIKYSFDGITPVKKFYYREGIKDDSKTKFLFFPSQW